MGARSRSFEIKSIFLSMELTLYVSVESFLDDYESRRMELGSSSIQNSVDNIARFGWYDRRYVDVTLRP